MHLHEALGRHAAWASSLCGSAVLAVRQPCCLPNLPPQGARGGTAEEPPATPPRPDHLLLSGLLRITYMSAVQTQRLTKYERVRPQRLTIVQSYALD